MKKNCTLTFDQVIKLMVEILDVIRLQSKGHRFSFCDFLVVLADHQEHIFIPDQLFISKFMAQIRINGHHAIWLTFPKNNCRYLNIVVELVGFKKTVNLSVALVIFWVVFGIVLVEQTNRDRHFCLMRVQIYVYVSFIVVWDVVRLKGL